MYQVLKEVIASMTASGEMFETVNVTVRGQQLKAWANAPASLRDVWLSSATYADRDYLIYQDERLTYTQAHDQVARIANWLVSHGVKQHDRVAIAMRNYPEWMLAYWAIVSIGAVPIGVNAWWVPEELKYGLKDSDPKLLICDAERLARFDEIRSDFPELPVVGVRIEDQPDWVHPWDELLRAEPAMPQAEIDPDDDACIFYTSGTTGFPKGAQLTHRGCTNNIFSYMFMTLAQATAEASVKGLEPPTLEAADAQPPSAIIATPLFHVTANNATAQTVTVAGGKLVHMYKWDAGEALRIIEQEKITNFSGVPVMAREIVSHPDFARYDTTSLSTIGGGGAAVQPDLIDKISNTNRIAPAQGYGLTENCGMASLATGIFLEQKPNSAGMVIPIYDVKCIDDQGKALPSGEPGEICLKGSQIIKGYLNRPEATAEAIIDGWFHTGDIGFVDEDNCIYLVDRVKDMVLRGGENVYCSEVEVALFKHEDVAECSVFGVPDERLGEEVGVAIYPRPGSQLSADALRAFCATKLAGFKVPRYFWIMDKPLPRNASGKFVKRELQQTLDISTAS